MQTEIMVLLDSAECDLVWSTAEGNREQRRIVEGQICLIGSQRLHSGSWVKPTGGVVLHVHPDFVEEVGGAKFDGVAVHDLAGIARDDLVIREMANAFRRLGRNARQKQPRYIESLATVFATHILQAHFTRDEPAEDRRCLTPAQLCKATDFIHVHLSEAISIKEIARHVHLSPFHFIRLFKRSTTVTPHQYLLRCRVVRAKELLRTGNFRVAEVAHAVGFCDQSHLDRHFRRHFGFPPSQLIKQHGEQQ